MTNEFATDTFPDNDVVNLRRDATPISTFPYFTNFNADSSNWYAIGRDCRAYFQYGEVPYLNGPDGEGNSWYLVVQGPGNTDFPALESPVFDFTEMTNPLMTFDIKVMSNNPWPYADRIVLEYSLDGGASWNALGAYNEPGLYDMFRHRNLPGWGRPANATGQLDTWTFAIYQLCHLAGEPCVQFRIKGYHIDTGEQFAIDNIRVTDGPDVSLTDSLQPIPNDRCFTDGNVPIEVEFFNYFCSDTINVPLELRVTGPGGNQVFSETLVGPATSRTILNYLFTDSITALDTGEYVIQVYTDLANDVHRLNDTLTWVYDRQYPVITTLPYTEDFESGPAGWFAYTNNGNKNWNHGPIPYINGPEGNGSSWYTVSNQSNYANFWVESPVFDLSGATNPVLSFDYKANILATQGSNVNVQYTLDGGATWQVLGDETTPRWYRDFAAWSTHTGFGPSCTGACWGGMPEWARATQSLCDLSGESCVQFRFLADRYQYNGNRFQFAFDNVWVTDGPDVSLTDSVQPNGLARCFTGGQVPIEVEFFNYMCSDTVNVPVEVRVTGPGGAQSISEIFAGPATSLTTQLYLFVDSITALDTGLYQIDVYTDLANDVHRLNDTLSWTYDRRQPIINTYPYFEDFESGDGAFIAYTNNGNKNWRYGALPYINGPEGNGNSWYTESNQSNYANFWLESPVFDFSSLSSPVMSFEIKANILATQGSHVRMEYTTDGGATWTTLGDETTPRWYSILPAWSTHTGFGPPCTGACWGGVEDWTTVTTSICHLAGESCVQFRLMADRYQYNSNRFQFGFDNFRVADGPEVMIAEPYAPSALPACFVGTTNLEATVYNNGCSPISSIPVTAGVVGPNGPQNLSETVTGPIAPGASVLHTFATPIDVAQAGTYNLELIASLPGDALPPTDTLAWSLERPHEIVNTFPYTESFNGGTGTGGWAAGGGNASRFFSHGTIPYAGGPDGQGDCWFLTVNDGSWTRA